MKIQQLQLKDIPQVARLHATELTESRMAKIGNSYIEQMYLSLYNNPDNNYCLVMKDGEKVIGICTATCDLAATQDGIKQQMRAADYWMILRALLTVRISVLSIARQLYVEWYLTHRLASQYPTILTICVSKQYQRQGIGRALLLEVFDHYQKKGLTELYVDTLVKNKPAQKFYHQLGFQPYRVVGDSQIFLYSFA